MVRECRPPARDPSTSWLVRRSTMTTSIPANASSPANISPVGPPPAITTACSVVIPAPRCPGVLDSALRSLRRTPLSGHPASRTAIWSPTFSISGTRVTDLAPGNGGLTADSTRWWMCYRIGRTSATGWSGPLLLVGVVASSASSPSPIPRAISSSTVIERWARTRPPASRTASRSGMAQRCSIASTSAELPSGSASTSRRRRPGPRSARRDPWWRRARRRLRPRPLRRSPGR